MDKKFSGNAILSETPSGFRIYTHHLQDRYFEVDRDAITINSRHDDVRDLADGKAYIANVDFNFPSIPIPGVVCDVGVSALLAIEPYRTWQTVIAASKAQGKQGNIDTTTAADACKDRAKALGLIGKVLPGPAGIAFDAISKLGDCCPKFYEKLFNG